MNIGVFGTGMVGNVIGSKLISLGHNVKMGSRTADNEKATAWAASQGPNASNGTYADAAAFGELIFNCTNGMGSMEAFKQAGAANVCRKLVVDISNPLDFSKGMPPSLSVCNTDSLAEQLQREFPEAKFVKTLNTVNCNIMVNPALLAGDHDMMLCGNDTDAKATVKDILTNWFGWKTIHDLGDLTGARGMEMWLPLWLRFMMTTGTANFNIRLVK
ncbi:MAG TPA: NAD(P)-binding domain-containing protein [Candidatus Kapabacteria bacterium]|nr:NAD(P)-binding domain-containing protein [Candidatus Kapabacteria bacterium]